MRVLCLNLQQPSQSPFIDAFLPISRQIDVRQKTLPNGNDVSLIFLDVTQSPLSSFSGEEKLLEKAIQLARRHYPRATASLSDTPQGAQLFTNHLQFFICPPGREKACLAEMPVTSLIHLEGLSPWKNINEVHQIISLLQILGLQHLKNLQTIRRDSLRQRWGETGELLWLRLHGKERQKISPLLITPPLKQSIVLKEPISLLSFLLYQVEKSMELLIDRLQGHALDARKIQLNLHCAYFNKRYSLEFSLNSPNQTLGDFLDLFEKKLSQINLENPIYKIDMEVTGTKKKTPSNDNLEKVTSSGAGEQRVLHLFRQLSNRSFPLSRETA